MELTLKAFEDFALKEKEVLRNSRTVRAVYSMEAIALGAFVEQLIAGQVEFSFASLRGWILAQAALVVVYLARQAVAGLEAQVSGLVPPEQVKKIEAAGYERALASIAKSHPDAAAALRVAASTPVPPEAEKTKEG